MNTNAITAYRPTRDSTRKSIAVLTYLLGIGLAIFTLYYAYTRSMMRVKFANLFLGFGLAIFYFREYLGPEANDQLLTGQLLNEGLSSGTSGVWDRIPHGHALNAAICVLFGVASICSSLYVHANFDRYIYESAVAGYQPLDILIGGLVIVLTLEATRRAFGAVITVVIMTAMGYALAGPVLPGLFYHSGMSVDFLIENVALGSSGVYGFILEVGTTWVAIFILFAGIAKVYGAMDYMRKLSHEIRKKFRTGFVLPAISASMFMGSLTGASAANVATTGSFTIPMMKDQGIDSRYAGAVESMASTGGQILPPVMGTAAFLMADIIDVSYVDVMFAGLLPAVLFYFAVTLTTVLVVYKYGWIVQDSSSVEWEILLKGGKYAVPIFVIIYYLVEVRATPLTAGLWAIVSIIAIEFLLSVISSRESTETEATDDSARSSPQSMGKAAVANVAETGRKTLDALNRGIVEMVPLLGVLATIGIVIEVFNRTGFSQRLSSFLVSFGGESLLIMLVIAMVASILFGLGMPTPAAYTIVAILVAPALTALGIEAIVAHMFVFYFAMLSAITPPVALAVVVASRIAGARFIPTAIVTLFMGLGAIIVPFVFVYNPELVVWSTPLATAMTMGLALLGITAVAIASTGYVVGETLSVVGRAIFGGLALVLFFVPEPAVQLIAVAVLVVFALTAYLNTVRIPLVYHRN
ncbi:TRAP transporter permease [Natronorubrum sp. FCH18a]|uniref:TRAP transporter permease n=1 Tax=Natronorubrum sp. FCH18a TaxID=3447018 RepID=UPI003F515F86